MSVKSMALYAKYFEKKFKDHSFDTHGNLLEENIMLGETLDWGGIQEHDCPRIEIIVHEKQGAGEVDNVSQDENLRLAVSCYQWNDNQKFTRQDYLDMLDFMDEAEQIIKEISSERAQGKEPSPDFLRLASYTDIQVVPDFSDNISSGIMIFTIVLTKTNY